MSLDDIEKEIEEQNKAKKNARKIETEKKIKEDAKYVQQVKETRYNALPCLRKLEDYFFELSERFSRMLGQEIDSHYKPKKLFYLFHKSSIYSIDSLEPFIVTEFPSGITIWDSPEYRECWYTPKNHIYLRAYLHTIKFHASCIYSTRDWKYKGTYKEYVVYKTDLSIKSFDINASKE